MTAITIAVTIAKFLRSRNPPMSDLSDVVRKLQRFRISEATRGGTASPRRRGCLAISGPLSFGPACAGAQQAVPDGNGQQDHQETDQKIRRQPVLRLRLAADPDHHSSDVIRTAGLSAP